MSMDIDDFPYEDSNIPATNLQLLMGNGSQTLKTHFLGALLIKHLGSLKHANYIFSCKT